KTLDPADLAIFYPYRPWPAAVAWSAGAAVFAATAMAVVAGRRRPYVLVGWLWYVVTLVPVIGIVQVGSQAMADRYTYVPQLGLSIIVAWGAAETLRDRRVALAASSAAIALACVVASARQVRHSRNTETLLDHAL